LFVIRDNENKGEKVVNIFLIVLCYFLQRYCLRSFPVAGLTVIKKNEDFLRVLDLETVLDKKDQNRVKEGHSFVMRDYWNLKRG